MTRVRFEIQSPVTASDPNRMDVALFVGYVDRRNSDLPAVVRDWLVERGWFSELSRRGPIERIGDRPVPLTDLPVPVDSWDAFDHLFAADGRVYDADGVVGPSYMGAAVRSFFAQGGRRCYVVSLGPTWPLTSPRDVPNRIGAVIPGFPTRVAAAADDRTSWRGVAHLFGLPDVSLLCLPDVPDIVRSERPVASDPTPVAQPIEGFVDCSTEAGGVPEDRRARRFPAPRCRDEDYGDWADVLRLATGFLQTHHRAVQLVASVPMPEAESDADADLLDFLTGNGWLSDRLEVGGVGPGISSAFLQLVYPWVRTPGSVNLPEGLESPDAVLVGALARNAITRGTFRSASHLDLADVFDVFPALRQIEVTIPAAAPGAAVDPVLIERISGIGFRPDGIRVLSDVTTSSDSSYRSAPVNRLVSVILRIARRVGEETVFESSSGQLWRRLREQLSSLLLALFDAGALRGETSEEAFDVRCDRSTMTQYDIDSGRVIAQVQFAPAAPIEQVTVVLAMTEGGGVSLVSERVSMEEAT